MKNFIKYLCLIFLFVSCNLNTENVEVEKAQFEKERIVIAIGESKQVIFNITPTEAIPSADVKYYVNDKENSIVSLSNITNNGLVVTGEKLGSCVLIAECNGKHSYLQILVEGTVDATSPYIVTNGVSYELNVGSKKSTTITINGVPTNRYALTEWKSSNSDVIELETVQNSCVMVAKKVGSSKITVTHPDCEYPAYFMVYSVNEGESATYITTSQNTIRMGIDSNTYNFKVSLVGSKQNNESLFIFDVLEGKENIDIIYNNNMCSITPKKEGECLINVTHPECEFPLEVRVVIVNTKLETVISCDKPFIELGTLPTTVECKVLNTDDSKDNYKFSYSVSDEDIISVTQVNNLFYVEPKKDGRAVIYVENEVCKYPLEIYCVVNSYIEQSENYISSTQGVIKMEVGDEKELDILLIGGTESDRNNFKWTVEDSSIIEVVTSDGEVSYKRDLQTDIINSKAIIIAKQEGITNIEIVNPKCKDHFNVKVKVYPKGTLNEVGYIKGSGIVKVLKNEETEHQVSIDTKDYKNVSWSVEDETIASVHGNDTIGIVNGNNKGITDLTVSGENLIDYKAIVMCGETEEDFLNMNAMYIDERSITVFKDNVIYKEIKTTLGTLDGFEISNNNNEIAECKVSGNVLVIKGLKDGECEIVISNESCQNTLTLFIKVESETSIEKPYYFNYEKFIGIVVGETAEVEVELVGSSESNLGTIVWEVEDESIVKLSSNENVCQLKATGIGETILYAKSPLSSNVAKIIVYTALTQDELNNRVILNVDKTNYLANLGENIYIDVDVNNKDYINKIEWNVDDISVVNLDSNYNSAYVKCIGVGNCTITVSCEGALEKKIYISVVEDKNEGIKDISIKSIVEAITGSNLLLKAESIGLTNEEINKITWSIEDSTVCEINGNGLECYLVVLKKGITNIIVKQQDLGIEKKILLVTADSYDELLSSYVMNLDNSYYQIKINDVINLNLTYGMKTPTEEIKSKILWENSDNNICLVTSNGGKASIKGLNEGISTIKIKGEGFLNSIEIKVCVTDSNGNLNFKYNFNHDKIIGIVKGESLDFTVKILNTSGQEDPSLYSDIEYNILDNSIIDVSQADNVFYIEAKEEGQTYINFSHPEVEKESKVLVYTAKDAESLKNMYPITTDQNYYLLNLGDKATLTVNTIDDSKVSNLTWSCSNSSICSYQISSDKKSLVCTAKKEGICTFTVSHPNSKENIIFTISVTQNSVGSNSNINIVSENIIFVKKGETYRTSITTTAEDSNFSWTSSLPGIATVDGYNLYADIKGVQKGLSEITVKYNSVNYRTIMCYVYEEGESINDICIINNDRRYYNIIEGNSLIIKPFSLRKNASIEKYVYEDVLMNDVVSFRNEEGRLIIEGKNEGVAKIKISNSESLNSYYIFVQVNPKGSMDVTDANTGYLTCQKNVYILDANDKVTPTIVNLIPIDINESLFGSIKWEIDDSSVATVIGNGEYAYVYANKEGETIIKAYSAHSSNILAIRIIVTSKPEEFYTEPYIYLDKTTYECKVGEYVQVECALHNAENYDITHFSATALDEEICNIYVSGNVIKLVGKKSGQTVVNIKYDDLESVNIVFTVQGVSENLVYLSTTQNYEVITEGEYKQIEVILNGYEELNGDNFIWEIISQESETSEDVIKLSGSGSRVVCYALNPGKAQIRVIHNNAEYSALYPLKIDIKVIDRSIKNPIYIKSNDTNVITVKEGERATFSCSLENGDLSTYSQFNWINLTESLFTMYGASNEAVIQGVKAGTGRVRVSHPDCIDFVEFVVIVETKEKEDALKITTDSTVIEMRPTDSYKQLNVTLVGGNIEQSTLFVWEILSYDSAIKNSNGTSNPVISMNGSQDSAIIKPLNEGIAIVRVKNSATTHYLDIKIIVSTFTNLNFEKSYVTMKQFETSYITVNAPTGKTVIYESSNNDVCHVTGTNKKCMIEGIGVGTAIVKAYCSDGSSSDEIAVNVTNNLDVISNYIDVNARVLTLNTEDKGGTSIKAELKGTDVSSSDQDAITYTISSGTTNVIKILGNNGIAAQGDTIQIVPIGAGEESIIISHPDAKNDKVVYIQVEQNTAILQVTPEFVTLNKGDVESFSASITGLSDVDTNSIVWTLSNEGIVEIKNSTNGVFKGDSCVIEAKAKEGECMLICTYGGNITKNISVFVEEIPSLNILASTSRVACGSSLTFDVKCVPEELYEDIAIEANSSIYGITTIEYDDANKVCKVTFTGSYVTGFTKITAKLGNLSSNVQIETSDEVYLNLLNYTVYDNKGNMIGDKTESPTNIYADANCGKVRVYYKAFPLDAALRPNGDVKFLEFKNRSFGSDYSSKVFVNITYGKDEYGTYFDVIPKSAGYGSLNINCPTNPNCNIDLPMCFYVDVDTTIKAKMTALSSNNTTHSIVDFNNSVLNFANTDKIEFSVNPGDSKALYNFTCTFTDNKGSSPKTFKGSNGKIVIAPSDLDNIKATDKVTYRSSSCYIGKLEFNFEYPMYYGNIRTYKKVMLVHFDEWK